MTNPLILASLRTLAQRLAHARVAGILKLLFAVGIFVAAAWVITRELKSASWSQIGATLASTPFWALMASIVATALSYLCLAASEWWALALVGRRLAAWRIGLVTFASYAASNALGFSLATGAAMRLRFYLPWGLGRREIAAVTLLAGLAVTLSGLVTAGIALFAVGGLPAWIYPLALFLTAPVCLWLARLPHSPPFFRDLTIVTPPLRRRTMALAGGVMDWVFSGFALFILLPNPAMEHFASFLAIFILGSLVSAASGVPGGIGVFEAVVLLLSKHFALSAETAAALLIYRLIYAVGPLTVTALGFAARQAISSLSRGPH